MTGARLAEADTVGPARRLALILVAWAAGAASLAGCSGQALPGGTNEGAMSVVPPEGTAKIEVLTFGTFSSYMEDPPLVIRPDIRVEFVAASETTNWWNSRIEGPASGLAEDDSIGPWDAKPLEWGTPEPESPRAVTTGRDGAASVFTTPGEYLVCAHFYDSRVAGCNEIQIPTSATVYVFFADGRAFIDAGVGPASDAYRRLSCHQQRRLGQRPEILKNLGGSRYRCLSR